MRALGPVGAMLVGTLAVACAARPVRAVAQQRTTAAPLFKGDTDEELARGIREHYTKYEHRIRMRDGVALHTVAYVPKDTSRKYPILLQRTPYAVAPYGVDNYPAKDDRRALGRFAPSTHLVRDGYVFVHQDVRGRMMSEGSFVDVRPRAGSHGVDEATDTFDTIDWLVKNVPGNNGRVGMWGISYPGFYAAQGAIDAHPALKAVSPQAPVTEWFNGDDFHHNGALFLADAFDFFRGFGLPRDKPSPKPVPGAVEHDTADVYDFFLGLGPLPNADARYFHGKIAFWNDLMAHGTRDPFWQARDPRADYAKRRGSAPAVLTVGGWFDAEDLYGTLETYRAFERRGGESTLVMGPWYHGAWARDDGERLGDVTFGQKTSHFYREHIEAPFFARHLKGENVPAPPEAWVFETGTNVWQRYATWPPAGKRVTLHFQPKSKLGSVPAAEAGADTYVSDPARPVPYRARTSRERDANYMTEDQRFAARRPDVLVYDGPALTEDVTLAGPVEASLWITTTGTDADFVVKLVDVYPQDHAELGGYQQLVRGEVMRGKFRSSLERPEPFRPGEPALVRFMLPDVSHTFRPGHHIQVQVQSSWFPLVDLNPQTFSDIYHAREADFRAATHRVLREPSHASSITVNVVRGTVP